MTSTQLRPVAFSTPDVDEDDIAAVTAVLRSGWLTTGSVAQDFEAALAAETGARYVSATSSCTTALESAVAALGLPPGARVAVPSWTFVSTVSVLLRLQLTPVMLDVEPTTLNLSAGSLERALDSGVSAVVPVHFAGTPVPADVLTRIAEAGLPWVEDCAHALGADLSAGPVPAARCYSFYATKNLTCAEGGAVATDDPDVDAFCRTYRLHGLSRDAWRRYAPGASATYDLVQRGIKANLPDLLAALGLSQLHRFARMQATRRTMVTRYRQQLSQLPGVRLVPAVQDLRSADHLMMLLLPRGVDRDGVVQAMADRGVTTSVHFQPVHRFRALREALDLTGGLSTCDRLWPRALSLPLHSRLGTEDVDRVVAALADALACQQHRRLAPLPRPAERASAPA